jgi:spore photoproduct lyase
VVPFTPERILVEERARPYPLTQRILRNLAGRPVEIVPTAESAGERLAGAEDPIALGKRTLLLAVERGRFVKPCPCAPGHVRCGYTVINLHLNCPLDCSYCVLQGYLANPCLTVHVNLDDLWRELDGCLASGPARRRGRVRLGTGELGDSLALDPVTGNSADLLGYMRGRPAALLELKTKTTHVEDLLRSGPADNVVVAWSLNTPAAAAREEVGAPPVDERLEAAAAVRRRGFRVAFHFDPLLRYPGWEKDYGAVVGDVFRAVDRAGVAWISLGSLRFPPALKPVIRDRFPASRLLGEELVRGSDGKFRYFRPLRVELYGALLDAIRTRAGGAVPVYLCMESAAVWREVYKKNPGGEDALSGFLSSRR